MNESKSIDDRQNQTSLDIDLLIQVSDEENKKWLVW